ncbi:hypothetical protein ALC56_01634 [Trachymyrmex septentrionalis]|uniref:DDE Tnp4 domain-containing protein n=1 Tax=Trachymyrmex septentrionalis TaxID=34720 RepID=A0A195FVL2_9HYME|nr:hypothetical protein ALC56_01634 [Trachymyrmex septentrionalis]
MYSSRSLRNKDPPGATIRSISMVHNDATILENCFNRYSNKMDTIEADKSRFVTKFRWIVEQVFDRLKKKFKIFSLLTYNATLTHNYESLLIVFAFLNLSYEAVVTENFFLLKSLYLDLEYRAIDSEKNN